MVNYSNTKIYKIESTKGNNIYIGSTSQKYLSKRMNEHRSNYISWKEGRKGKIMSFDLFDEYGVENCYIVLLETFPCNSKDEAYSREAYYIKSLDCVNKIIPGRTKKEYRQDNKEQIKQNQQQYDSARKMDKKQYRVDHKEHINQYMAKYREDNKDKTQEKSKLKYTCACGSESRFCTRARHEKTSKHLKYLKSLI